MLTATKNTNVDFDRIKRSEYGAESLSTFDRFYDRTAKDTIKEYRDHLYDSLTANRQVRGSDEYEDEIRYREITRNRNEARENTQYMQKNAVTSKRVLKKKMIPLVACYFLMVAVIVALIVVNVSGTAWEAESFSINPSANIVPQETANAVTNPVAGEVALNTVVTNNGAVQISLSPYPNNSTDTNDTNWFDRFCDWVSNLSGG